MINVYRIDSHCNIQTQNSSLVSSLLMCTMIAPIFFSTAAYGLFTPSLFCCSTLDPHHIGIKLSSSGPDAPKQFGRDSSTVDVYVIGLHAKYVLGDLYDLGTIVLWPTKGTSTTSREMHGRCRAPQGAHRRNGQVGWFGLMKSARKRRGKV